VSTFPALSEIRSTRTALQGLLRQTPCVEFKPGELASDSGLDSSLVFKLELFQVTGTFKIVVCGANIDLATYFRHVDAQVVAG
jgi:threonine dehydratase